MLAKLESIGTLAIRRFATSLFVWGFTAPFMIVGLVFTELTSRWTLQSVGKALAVGLVGHLALGLVLVIARHTVLNPTRTPHPDWRHLLLVLGSGGLVRGLAIASFAVALGVGDWRLLTRIPTSVILVTFSFTVAAYGAELWVTYRTRRAQLLLSLAQGNVADTSHQIASRALLDIGVAEDIEAVNARAKTAIATIRSRIQAGSARGSDLDEFMNQTDSDWRSVSHTIMENLSSGVPRITALELIRTLSRAQPISLIVLSAGPVYGLLRVFDGLPLATALGMSVAWLVGALVLATTTNYLSAKLNKAGIPIFVLGIVALQGWAITISTWAVDSDLLRSQVIFVSVVSSIAAVGMGLPQALERSGGAVLRELEERVSASTIRRLKAQGDMFAVAQRVGLYLHTEVRGDFLRLSMELRTALETGNSADALRILEEIESRLTDVDPTVSNKRPGASLRDFLENWGRVIDLQSNLDTVTIPAHLENSVELVLMEAVNDAVRHGHATWVSINASEHAGGVVVEVDSDSEVQAGHLPEGIGSRTLERVAPGKWSRAVTPEGSLRLSVTLVAGPGSSQTDSS